MTRQLHVFVCTGIWRDGDYKKGDKTYCYSYGEDDLNYYAYGISDEYPIGRHTNFIALPKHTWVKEGIRD